MIIIWHVCTRGSRGIRINDFRFIRHGPNQFTLLNVILTDETISCEQPLLLFKTLNQNADINRMGSVRIKPKTFWFGEDLKNLG